MWWLHNHDSKNQWACFFGSQAQIFAHMVDILRVIIGGGCDGGLE